MKRQVPPTVMFQSRYSGQHSRAFWTVVKSLSGADHECAYAMGCALQDLESRVLNFIVLAQDRRADRITRKVKRS